MPRKPREKTEEAIFHIMARSISEVDLFKDKDDKKKYLSLVKKYQTLYKFRVYGYCLMDTHVHMIIDANGADISSVMHSINYTYAQYFNATHKRHGHLFQDRFKSKMVQDDNYLIALSAYVHSNPTSIKKYEDCPEKYEFSSLSVYLGLKQDPYELIDDGFLMSMFGPNSKIARKNYAKLVYMCTDEETIKHIEFEDEGTEYKSCRRILVRKINADEIVKFIMNKFQVSKVKLQFKYCRSTKEAKAIMVFMMRSLCNFKCSTICSILGNITQARVSTLSSLGIELIDDQRYRAIVEEFMSYYCA